MYKSSGRLRFSATKCVVAALAAAAACGVLRPASVSAHPHVWVTARAQMIFEGDRLAGVRHSWTFDPAYSFYATQGLDSDGDGKLNPGELEDLARINIEGLYEFDFFTKVKANGAPVTFTRASDSLLEFKDGALVLHFTLPVEPAIPAARALAVEVYDPTYFVSFVFAAEDDAASVIGRGDDCAVTITRPKQPDFNEQEDLSEAFFNALTVTSTFGQDFATRAVVACP